MPRPTYPSDEARKRVRPHVKVHLSVATHRKTYKLWSDPARRGMLVELWRIALQAFSAKTGNKVHLSEHHIKAITGKSAGHGWKDLLELCEELGYELVMTWRKSNFKKSSSKLRANSEQTPSKLQANSKPGASWLLDSLEISIPKFAEKQGIGSASGGATPRTTPASYSDSDSDSDISPPYPPFRGGGGVGSRKQRRPPRNDYQTPGYHRPAAIPPRDPNAIPLSEALAQIVATRNETKEKP